MRGAVDRGFVMAMFNWAIVALKVLLFIWAAQLTWMGSRLLEHHWAKRGVARSGSEDAPREAAAALRSSL
jgi:hypothetical protein